jgi:hypothetical protein
MGLSPQQVGDMSIWQFMACADGYARSKDPNAAKRSNDDAFEDIEAMFDAAPEHLA